MVWWVCVERAHTIYKWNWSKERSHIWRIVESTEHTGKHTRSNESNESKLLKHPIFLADINVNRCVCVCVLFSYIQNIDAYASSFSFSCSSISLPHSLSLSIFLQLIHSQLLFTHTLYIIHFHLSFSSNIRQITCILPIHIWYAYNNNNPFYISSKTNTRERCVFARDARKHLWGAHWHKQNSQEREREREKN